MSKKHRRINPYSGGAQQPTNEETREGLIDIDQLGGETAEAPAPEAPEELVEAPEAPSAEPAPEAPAPAAEVAEEPAPEAEEVKETPAAPEPAPAPAAPAEVKAQEVKIAPETKEPPKVIVRVAPARPHAMASARAPNTRAVTQLQQTVSEDLSKHSIVGRQVIKMFDEYIAIRKSMNPKNVNDRNRAARKLYDIVVTCCPRNSTNRNAAYDHELIMICFKRMSQYFGTYFTDKSLLSGDYTLPSPSEAIKFDAFYGALYQLADAAKTGARITFNMKTLGTLLNAPGAAKALQTIKERLESRNA